MAFHAFFSWKPARSTWSRRWSSSLIITEKVWSLLMTTPPPPFEPLSSRLMRWRSTRIWRSRSVSSSTVTFRPRFICGAAATAWRQVSSSAARSAFAAQPGKDLPARLRARRTRVISTIAVLLLAESVSSHGVSMSEAIVMGSTRGFFADGLFDLVNFIAVARGFLVTLGFDGVGEVELEFGKAVVK